MRVAKLASMVRGWFVGDFTPTLYQTAACEVGARRYESGFREAWHYHKIATEITVILEGIVEMNGIRYKQGDMLVLDPGDGTDFLAVTDCILSIVKIPCVLNDKYMEGE